MMMMLMVVDFRISVGDEVRVVSTGEHFYKRV